MTTSTAGRGRERIVDTMHAVRTASFIFCFAVIGLHLWQNRFGALWGVALVAQYLVYPHVLRWRTRRSAGRWATETGHLYLDSFLLGVWIAALGFPTWIAYALIFSTSMNAIVTRALAGLAVSIACSAAGTLTGIMLAGYRIEPATSELVTALCFFGAIAYSCGVGFLVYRQAVRIAETRQALRASEAQYRLIAENAGDLIAMVDADGRWIYSSPSYARVLSPEDTATGADAFLRIHPADVARARQAMGEVLAREDTCALTLRLQAHDGSTRLFDMLMHRVPGGDGSPARVVLVSRDVTSMQQQREQLNLAAHAYERMSEAMIISSADGIILSVNRAYSAITGWSAGEVVGRHERKFRTALQPESFFDEIRRTVNSEGYWTGSTWSRRKDDTLFRERRTVSCVRDDNGALTHYITNFLPAEPRDPAFHGA